MNKSRLFRQRRSDAEQGSLRRSTNDQLPSTTSRNPSFCGRGILADVHRLDGVLVRVVQVGEAVSRSSRETDAAPTLAIRHAGGRQCAWRSQAERLSERTSGRNVVFY